MALSLPAIIVYVALALAVGYVLATKWGPTIKRGYEQLEIVRRILVIPIVAIVAWTLLNSGNALYVGAALVSIVAVAAWWMVERPDKDLV